MKITLSVLLVFFITHTQAQQFTISGTLKDAENGEDLIGSSIRVKENPDLGKSLNN